MQLTKEKGMVFPFALFLITAIALMATKIYALSELNRGIVYTNVKYSRALLGLKSIEDLVLRKLPLIDVKLFKKLNGLSDQEPIQFQLPTDNGMLFAEITGAQRCINIAPLFESDEKEKAFSQEIIARIFNTHGYQVPDSRISGYAEDDMSDIPEDIAHFLCHLPGAGQKLAYKDLTPLHGPILNAISPEQNFRHVLKRGFTQEEALRFNEHIKREVLVGEQNFFWLTVEINDGDYNFYSKSLIKIHGRSASIVFRHLKKDNML